MSKYTKFFIVLIALFALLTIGIFVFNGRPIKLAKKQNNITAPKPSLIEQLYGAKVPNFGLGTEDFVELRGGKIEERWPDGGGYWSIYLDNDSRSYIVADFNNDGLDDIAIVIGATGGGSGYFYNLTVFMNKDGHLNYLTSQEIGDRIKVNKISYNSGVIIADIITQGPNEGLCCGTMPATLKFRIQNNLLVPVIEE